MSAQTTLLLPELFTSSSRCECGAVTYVVRGTGAAEADAQPAADLHLRLQFAAMFAASTTISPTTLPPSGTASLLLGSNLRK